MLSFDPQPQRMIAHGMNLGMPHLTLCRVSLEPGVCRLAVPEPVTLPRSVPAGTRFVSLQSSQVSCYGVFCSWRSGSNSSRRLFGQVGSLSRVSLSQAAGSRPLSLAVPNRL